MDGDDQVQLEKHAKYFERGLKLLPGRYQGYDTNRMTLAFFSINGLELLDAYSNTKLNKDHVTEWIYSLQVTPQKTDPDSSKCGFRGSTTNGQNYKQPQDSSIIFDTGHVAMTYTALSCLAILEDDFSRLNREAILAGLTKLQLDDGSFMFSIDGTENDMRFLYCACCICYMLNDFSTINADKAVIFILKSISYEGGIGQGPNLEAHGGSTFCAVASLYLMGCLDSLSDCQRDGIINWCLLRQQSGFQGRPNKAVDTCYSFWIGATLKLLDAFENCHSGANRTYILSTQDLVTGGFSKWTSTDPDPLHSYMGLAALSLMEEPGILKLHTALNISQRAAARICSTFHRTDC